MDFQDPDALHTLANLAAPVWVFDTERYGIWWANHQALRFWKADSLQELQQRDFQTDSSSVRHRLTNIRTFGSSAPIRETWTLYPRDVPKRVLLSFQPITIESERQALLIEVVRHQDDLQDDVETTRVSEASRVADFFLSSFTLAGRLLAQNPSAALCYGLPPDGNAQVELMRRLGNARFANQLLQRVAAGEEFALEADMHTQAGKRRHLLSLRKGRDPLTGEPIAVLSEQDITALAAQRQQQDELNAQLHEKVAHRTAELELSQKRYELALKTASIWDWNLDTGEFFLSETFNALLGYDISELSTRLKGNGLYQLEKVMHTNDIAGFRNSVALHLGDKDDTLRAEIRLFARDGSTVWVCAEGSCILNAAGLAGRSVGLITNITERKQLEAQLLTSQRQDAVGQLTGGIAHDFNNLLSVILGNAELLKELGTQDLDSLQEIITAVHRGAKLTGQLLAFARKQALNPQNIDLNPLLERLQTTLLRTLRENILVDVTTAPDLWGIVADPAQLENAVLNVAINARDAMPDGGRLSISCTNLQVQGTADEGRQPAELRAGRYVELRIHDTGVGITEDILPKVYEPFFSTKEVGKGSGLGLSMVKGFAQQSGGNCEIRSEVGVGTAVTLVLPAGACHTDKAPRPAATDKTRGAGEHVHIVDDDLAVRATVTRSVEALGYRVSWSSDARIALDKIADGLLPDVFLIDVVLPGGLSGIELAEYIKREHPDVLLFLMSGHPGVYAQDVRDSDLRLLRKPFDQTTLSRLLAQHLNAAAKHPKV